MYLAVTHLGGAGVWVALLVLQHHGAIGDPSALASAGTGVQTLVAIAALIGFGTKAGFMPLHVWLPRAHPVAPAHLSALMSGMMIKVALYGLIRVEFQWLGVVPALAGDGAAGGRAAVLARGCAVGACAARPQATAGVPLDRERGIIALALGASLLFADAGDAHVGSDRVRRGAAAHRQPRDLQGAAVPGRRGVRARRRQPRSRSSRGTAAPHAVDRWRVPGRHRWRSPGCRRSTASRRSGSMLQSLLHAAFARPVARRARRRRGARRRWRRPRRSRCCASSRSSVWCCSARRGAPSARRRSIPRSGCGRDGGPRGRCGRARPRARPRAADARRARPGGASAQRWRAISVSCCPAPAPTRARARRSRWSP